MTDESLIDLGTMVLAVASGELHAPPTARAVQSAEVEGTTLFVASTETEDRAMDVVRQDWRLTAYKRNPVILDNHDYRRIVGVGLDAWVPRAESEGIDANMVGRLLIRVQWDRESPDPAIADVGRQHLAGIRRAGSVGFRAGKKTERHKLASDSPYYREPMEVETWWGGSVKVSGNLYERNELYEFSSATIPMNSEAIQRALGGAPESLPALPDLDALALELAPRLAKAGLGEILAKRAEFRDAVFASVDAAARTPAFGSLVRGHVESVPVPSSTRSASGPTFAELVLRAMERA